jgi:hypothetical protein
VGEIRQPPIQRGIDQARIVDCRLSARSSGEMTTMM